MDINTVTHFNRYRTSTDANRSTYTTFDIQRPELGTRSFDLKGHPRSEEAFAALFDTPVGQTQEPAQAVA